MIGIAYIHDEPLMVANFVRKYYDDINCLSVERKDELINDLLTISKLYIEFDCETYK